MISNDTLILLPPSMDLVAEFHAALVESYDQHMQFLDWAEPEPRIDSTRKNMGQALSNFERKETELRFIVRRKSDDRIVGCVGLIIRNIAIPYFEIGYWVRSSESGKGYTTQAVQLVEQFAVENLGAKRLEIRIAVSNRASRRVAEKAGFGHEALIRSDRLLPSGEIDDTDVFCKIF